MPGGAPRAPSILATLFRVSVSPPPTFMIVGVAVASPVLDSHLLSQTAGPVLDSWADRGQRGAFHSGHTCGWDRAAEKQLEVTGTQDAAGPALILNRCTKTVKEGTEPENRNTPHFRRLRPGQVLSLHHSFIQSHVHSFIKYVSVSCVPASSPWWSSYPISLMIRTMNTSKQEHFGFEKAP